MFYQTNLHKQTKSQPRLEQTLVVAFSDNAGSSCMVGREFTDHKWIFINKDSVERDCIISKHLH